MLIHGNTVSLADFEASGLIARSFDHRFLAVAAVFSIFSNLSPFVQFVGRIMRVIVQNAAEHVVNQGVVVFHAGANIARQWATSSSTAKRTRRTSISSCRCRVSTRLIRRSSGRLCR